MAPPETKFPQPKNDMPTSVPSNYRLLSPEPSWLVCTNKVYSGLGSRHCHGINYAHNPHARTEPLLKHGGDDQKTAADCDEIFRQRHPKVGKPKRFHQAMADLITSERTGNTAEDAQDRADYR